MTNRLADALSPYLQQHAENPVDWWQWSDEAFERARERDVPVLLSIGYAACHWCHVMAHESFEDPETAELMNELFVNIKVDREERPDVDAVYMAATVGLTGQGGWPMTVFLDHERRPFFAGTYFPPVASHGRPDFRSVLAGVTQAWRERRGDVERASQEIVRRIGARPRAGQGLQDEVLAAAVSRLASDFDQQHGGFGTAPKFPQPMVHEFLLRHHARTGDPASLHMAQMSLTAMVSGGMYDQIGGGFARYSVDAEWVVPHFEKMLYDNALLMRVYLHWWRETGSPLARQVVSETAEFLLREMLTDQGCFASSLDADSEGREGTFYVWTPEQVRQAGVDPELFGVTQEGTFEHGTSVLQRPVGAFAEQGRRLLEVRDQRPRPARDDKVVLAWNAWAISALAEAGVLLDRPDWLHAAQRCRDALWDIQVDGDALFRVSRDGVPGDAPAVLEDYAALASAEFTLAGITGGTVDRGLWLVNRLVDLFIDRGRDSVGGDLPEMAPDMTDNATPSGWSMAAEVLLTASGLTEDVSLCDNAESVLAQASFLAGHPQFWGHGLSVAEALLDGPREVAVIADPGSRLHRTSLAGTRPGAVIGLSGPLCESRPRMDGRDTVYVCRAFVCDAPTVDDQVLREQLRVRVGP